MSQFPDLGSLNRMDVTGRKWTFLNFRPLLRFQSSCSPLVALNGHGFSRAVKGLYLFLSFLAGFSPRGICFSTFSAASLAAPLAASRTCRGRLVSGRLCRPSRSSQERRAAIALRIEYQSVVP